MIKSSFNSISILAFLISVASLAGEAAAQSFTEDIISTNADFVQSVFAIDVDGDGDIDVLSGSSNDDKIAWYENDGSEGFTERVISTNANGALSVFAIDVDGDGDIDVLSASFFDDKIAWYENNGSEGFTERVISTNADGARAVFAIDVDGDGDIDVLSASNNDDKIAWYENDGSEGFTGRVISTDADAANSVFAIDVDGDDDIDVLSASINDDKIAWYESVPNVAPSFTNGTSTSLTAIEDAAATSIGSQLDTDDTDSDQTLTWSVSSGPSNGTLAGFPATASSGGTNIQPGSVTYEPDPEFSGLDSFDISVSDGNGGTADITVNVTITAVADTPSVTNATTDEDVQTTSGLVISRNADDGAEVTHFKITGITGGALYHSDGTTQIANDDFITFAEGNAGLKFTPTQNSTSDGSFDVQASLSDADAGLGGGTATATIAVAAVNDPPVFVSLNSAPTLTEDNTHTFGGDNLVAISDVDAGGADLVMTVTATSTFTAASGSGATIDDNGTSQVTITGTEAEINGALDGATYTPSENQTSGATVTFSVNDGGNTGEGGAKTTEQVITFTITAVNDAPGITSAAAVDVPENTTSVQTVTFDDPDVGDDHAFSITGGADEDLFSVDASSGALTFDAAPDFEAPTDADEDNVYHVQVTVTDEGDLTDVIDIAVTVTNGNDAPVITSAAAVDAAENQLSVMTVTATDVDNDDVTFSITGGADGDLFSVDASTGVLTFDAAPDFEAPTDADEDNVYNVEVTATDDGVGLLTNVITIAVAVTNANEDPAITGLPADATVLEDVASDVDLSAATFSDPDAGGNDIELQLAVNAGTLTSAAADGATVTGSGTATITLTGTLAEIDAFLNTASNIQYTGASNANGNDAATLTLTANDQGHVGDGGGGDVALGTVNIDIDPVADTPSVTNASTDEDVQTTAGLVISRNADDGAEVTHFKITGIKGGALYHSDGTTQIANDDFITFAEGNAGLKFTPTQNSTSNGSFDVQASLSEANGGLGGSTVEATITVTAQNDPPVFAVGNANPTIIEEGTHTFNGGDFIAISDVDAGGADLVMTVTATSTFTADASGTADIQDNGTDEVTITGTVTEINGALDGATYTPTENQTSGAAVTFSVNDGGNTGEGGEQTTEQVITFTITPVNDAPVITSSATVNASENQTAVQTVTFDDPDVGDDHAFSITGGADEDLFSVDASTGALTFDAAPDFEAPTDVDEDSVYHVQVTVTDEGDLTDVIDIAVTVTDGNDAPVITSDAAIDVAENTTSVLTVTATDPDNDDVTFSITGGADGNLFSVDAVTGVLTFDAAPDFEAPTDADEDNVYDVQVTATDDGNGPLTDVIAIAVTVTNVNDDPAITGLPADATVLEDVASDVDLSAATFTDPDAGGNDIELQLAVDAGTLTSATAGGVTVTGSGTTAITLTGTHAEIDAFLNTASSIQYTGALNANGNDAATLTLTANDQGHTGDGGGGDVALGTVNIDITAINDAPSFTAGADQTVDEDSGDFSLAGWASAISTGPVDEAAQTVTFNVTNNNSGLFATQPAISADGELTFTPADDANGMATVSVTLSDDGGIANGGEDTSPAQEFTITVNAVNDAPVVSVPGSQTIDEDTQLTFSSGDGNAITVSDVDAVELSVTLTATSTIDLAQTTGLTIGGGADGSSTMTITGTIADINDALDGLVYTPSVDQIAGASLTIEVSDGGATGSGGTLTDSETITINITSVNDIPEATPDLVTTDEDTAITIAVLANDSDPDGDALSVSIAVPASNGTALLNPNGTVTYTPDANFFGEDRFDYTATDPGGLSDTEAVRITVTPVNDAPVAGDDVAKTDQGSAVVIAVLDNDSDVEGAVAIESVGTPGNGVAADNGDGTITYTPDAGFFGEDNFTYTITDGELTAQATVTVTVNSTNNAPTANSDVAVVFAGESVQINLVANDTDPDGDDLTVTQIDSPAQGTATNNGDGTITYTAGAEASGEDVFSYTITDGIATAQGTITVTISTPGIDGDGVDDDVENDAPNDGDGNGDGIQDNEQENVASLPIAEGENAGSYVTVGAPAGQPLSQVQSTMNPSPEDYPEGASSPIGFLAYSVSNVPESGTSVTINYPEDAVVTAYMKYGPTPDDSTPHWYNFSFDGRTGAIILSGRILLFFQDGERGDDDLTINGTIVDPGTPVFLQGNAAPVAANDNVQLPEDAVLQIDVLANDTDADGDVLTVMLDEAPSHGSAVVEADGLVTYTPEADFFGEDTFTYTVLDPDGAASEATVTLTVTPVQDAPVATHDEATTMEDASVTIDLFANDYDVDGDVFWLTSQDDPQHGTSIYNDDGTVTYTPDPGFHGTDTWTYTISDGPDKSGQTVFASITVTVEPGVSTDAEDFDQELPIEVFLRQNYPNPFNPNTTIEFGLPESGQVRIEIFDVQGRLVKVLVSETLPAGTHSQQLHLGDIPSGVYLYRLKAGTKVITQTMQLVK